MNASVACRVASPEQMRELGAAIGRVAEPGDRLLLEGPFGAGKTTFVQGLAAGLGVPTPVSSPSFVLENQYRGRLPLYHIDLYRLDRLDPELLDSLEDHVFGDGVAAIEWPERLPPDWREGATAVHFEHDGAGGRQVTISTEDARVRRAAARAGERLG